MRACPHALQLKTEYADVMAPLVQGTGAMLVDLAVDFDSLFGDAGAMLSAHEAMVQACRPAAVCGDVRGFLKAYQGSLPDFGQA